MDTDLEQIVAALKAHFSTHANAADTLDGIASWWLAGPNGNVSKALVGQALQRLIDAGLVVARRTANGTLIYALKR